MQLPEATGSWTRVRKGAGRAREAHLHRELQDRHLLPVLRPELTPRGREADGYGHGQLQVNGGHGHDKDPAPGQAPQRHPEALPGVLREKSKELGRNASGRNGERGEGRWAPVHPGRWAASAAGPRHPLPRRRRAWEQVSSVNRDGRGWGGPGDTRLHEEGGLRQAGQCPPGGAAVNLTEAGQACLRAAGGGRVGPTLLYPRSVYKMPPFDPHPDPSISLPPTNTTTLRDVASVCIF